MGVTKGKDGQDGQEESEDSFRKKKANAIRELDVILNYLVDFKDITEVLKKQMKSDAAKRQAAAAADSTKLPEMNVRFEAAAPQGDRGSQNSGSQGNTRELSKSVQNQSTAGGSSAAAAEAAPS